MKGAREYSGLFETGRYGRLYITSGEHARGKTFRIQVLPEGEKALPNGSQNQCLNEDAVTVYGVTGGNPGWTETYGWLHKGKWCEDFEKLVSERRAEIAKDNAEKEIADKQDEDGKRKKITELLLKY